MKHRTSRVERAMVFMLCLSAAACHSKTAGGPPGGPRSAAEVGVVTVRNQSVPLTTELPGRTTPYAVSEVRPQVSGIILQRLFVEGSNVRKGQPLYHIDPATYRAALDQANATVESARANAVTTQVKNSRYGDLVVDNAVSRQEADDAKAAARQATALVDQNLATRRSAAINLAYTTVRAPITGRIGRSSFTQGALVSAAQSQALTTIQTLDPIYVDVTQSAADVLKLREALASGKRLQGGGFFNVWLKLEDGSLYPYPGKITAAEAVVDTDTGSVTLRAIFPNPQKLLLPGMYVREVVQQGVPTGAMLVSQKAVSRDPKGDATVLIVNAGGQAEQRVISVTQAVGGSWLVTAGLRPGERVIVEGLQNARPGMPVHAVPAGSRPQQPAAGPPASTQ